MFFFPALFFIFVGFILQGSAAKMAAGILALITLGTDVYSNWWAADLYTLSFAILVFLQNPLFTKQWNTVLDKAKLEKRPKATAEQVKHYRIAIFIIACSFIFPIIGFYSMAYPDHTDLLILCSGVLAFILGTTYLTLVNYGKTVVGSSKPKTDKSMSMTIIALFATWPLAFIAFVVVKNNLVIPSVLIVLLGSLAILFMHGKARYLAAGTIVIIADFSWRLGNYLMMTEAIKPMQIGMQVATIIVMLSAVIWLLRKPGILAFSILSLLIAGRYFMVIYQIYTHLASGLTTMQLVQVTIFQTSWMLIVPILLFWVGMQQLLSRNF